MPYLCFVLHRQVRLREQGKPDRRQWIHRPRSAGVLHPEVTLPQFLLQRPIQLSANGEGLASHSGPIDHPNAVIDRAAGHAEADVQLRSRQTEQETSAAIHKAATTSHHALDGAAVAAATLGHQQPVNGADIALVQYQHQPNAVPTSMLGHQIECH